MQRSEKLWPGEKITNRNKLRNDIDDGISKCIKCLYIHAGIKIVFRYLRKDEYILERNGRYKKEPSPTLEMKNLKWEAPWIGLGVG